MEENSIALFDFLISALRHAPAELGGLVGGRHMRNQP